MGSKTTDNPYFTWRSGTDTSTSERHLPDADRQGVVTVQPNQPTTIQDAGGFQLTIPAGAVSAATDLHWAVANTGGSNPQVSFWPPIALNQPVTVDLALDSTQLPQGFNGNYLVTNSITTYVDDPSSPDEVTPDEMRTREVVLNPTPNGSFLRVTTSELGEFTVVPAQEYTWAADGTRAVLPDASLSAMSTLKTESLQPLNAGPCGTNLQKQLDITNGIKQRVESKGAIFVSTCLKAPLWLNIVVVDLKSARNQTDIHYLFQGSNTSRWLLRRVKDLATSGGLEVAINGAPFKGGPCDSCALYPPHRGIKEYKGTWFEPANGAWGFPVTTTIDENRKLKDGDRTQFAGEAVPVFSQNTGTGIKTKLLADTPTTIFPLTDPDVGYIWTALGSTTSIVKDATCTRKAGDLGKEGINTFSAIGMGNGRLVFVSSHHGHAISIEKLCEAFLGLNATEGAVLLDSGAAAQLVFSGKLLNPITSGLERAGFRDAQRVAYAFGTRIR